MSNNSFEDLNILDQLRLGVGAGLYDDQLDAISEIVSIRKKLIRAERDATFAESLKIGDKVMTRNVSPQYLSGLVGTVVDFKDGRVQVDLGRPIRKYSRLINFLPSQLTKDGS